MITKDYQKEDYVFYILDPSPEEAVANDIFDPSSDANFSALLYGRTSEYFSGIGYSCIELNNDTWPAGYLAIFKCSSHDIDKLYSYLDDMKVIYSPIGDVDQKLWGTYYSDFLQAYPYEKFIK